MKREKKFLLRMLALLVGVFLITACAPSAQKTQTDGAAANNPITDDPGFYEDKTLGYSMTYPAGLLKNRMEARKGEVLRVRGSGASMNLNVIPLPEGLSLADTGEWHKNRLIKMYPDSTRHRVTESNVVDTASGVKGNLCIITWSWQGQSPLVTVIMSIPKNDMLIFASTSVRPGFVERQLAVVKGLKVQP